jgi:acyl-CoA synthetase (AMP-forming)/AMP-acid ligase II
MATADAARAEQRRRAGPGRHRACADQLSGALPGRRVPVDHEPGNSLGRIAYVAYTSGSTGTPKGIAQSHGAFAQFVTWLAGEFGIGPSSRVAQWVAPEHDPSLCEAYAALCAGATLCTVPARIRLHPEKLVDWLADERITFLQTIPSFARELLKVIVSRPGQARLAALDHLVLMGEALPGDLANGLRAALPSVRLANVYGPTETIAAAWHEITDQVTGTVPVGRPIPGRHLLVLDDQDRPCPAGVTGQIVIRSPYVAAGYIGGDGADSNTDSNTDSSAGSSAGSDTGSNAGGGAGGGAGGRAGRGDDSFRPVRGTVGDLRCYRTGDLGRWRWDGLLEFRGRRDLQVKVAGTRVELAAVAAALASHACVGECAVVPLADPDGLVTHLIAYLVLHRAPAAEPAGLREMLRAHLRRHFGTSLRQLSFHVLGHPLPRTAGGKVDRRRLPDPRTVLSRADRPPRTPAERGLAQIWSQLLGTGPAAADETFFAAGGHSLLVPQLIDRVRERFGVTIQIRDCLAHPSLAGLSRLIEAAGAGAPPGAPPDPADAEAAAMQITQ